MLFRFLIFLCFLCFITSVSGQSRLCSKIAVLENFTSSEKYQEALTYLSKDAHEKALELINELHQEARENNDVALENYSLYLEAELLYKTDAFKRALEVFKKLLNQPSVNEGLEFYTLFYLGNIELTQLKSYDEAIAYYKRAEGSSFYRNCPENKAMLYNILGNTFISARKYNESEKYYKLELNEYIINNNSSKAVVTYSNLGNLYFEQYEDYEAEKYFLKALETIRKKDSSNIKVRQTIYKNLSAVYEATGRFEKGLQYLSISNTLKDSIWNRDKVWELSEISKEFEVTQKQQEVDLLQAENDIKAAQRNGLFLSALILIALLAMVFYFYKVKAKSNTIIKAQKDKVDQLNATKDTLFSIVSHDLRSSVNALKTSNGNLQETLASNNLEKLDGLLNRNSSIVNGAYNLLDNLLNWALLQTKQSYFEITEHRLFFIVEQVAYNYTALMSEKNITFENTVKKKDKAFADQESLKIILRNLIDNAIKFSSDGGEIKIYTIHKEDSFCHLIIEDTGMGMTEKARLELQKDTGLLSKKENEDIIGTGLGLELCKSMIKKNGGQFSIESTLGEGTKMIVSLSQTSPNG